MPLYAKRPSPLTSRVARPVGRAVPFQFKASATPKMSLKPGPTSITSRITGRTMANPTISGEGSSGSMGNVVKNALTGAVVGGGAKMAYDYLTKKPAPKTATPISGITKQATSAATKAATGALTKAVTPSKPAPSKPAPSAPTRSLNPAAETPVEEPPVEETPPEETPAEEVPEEVVAEEPQWEESAEDTSWEDSSDYSSDDYSWDDSSDYSWGDSWRKGGLITMMRRGGIAHLADGGLPEDAMEMNDYPGIYMSYDADGNMQFMDADGNMVENPYSEGYSEGEVDSEFLGEASEPDYVTEDPSYSGEETTYIGDDGSTYTTGPDGSVRSTPATDYTQGTSSLFGSDFLSPDLLGSIKGALPAAGAGALLATLLGSDFGSSGRQNQGVDMSQLSRLDPRTTDFGIGPARFVSYDEYGSQDQMPEIYGEQLYGDLGTPAASDFNMEQYEPSPDLSNIQDYGNADQLVAYADGGEVESYYSYGTPVDPFQAMQVQAMKQGGLPSYSRVPVTGGRLDFRKGSAVHGPGDGQSDDIPAMLADGEYVFDADTVAALGNGSTKAGALALDKMREQIRKHKRSAPVNKIPPPAKSPLAYLKGRK